MPNVSVADQPPTLRIRATLSGSTRAAEQKTSVWRCISRQARSKSLTRLKSSSYAPVEFANSDVPLFSRKETLPFIPTVASSGGTRPGTRYYIERPLSTCVHADEEGNTSAPHIFRYWQGYASYLGCLSKDKAAASRCLHRDGLGPPSMPWSSRLPRQSYLRCW